MGSVVGALVRVILVKVQIVAAAAATQKDCAVRSGSRERDSDT